MRRFAFSFFFLVCSSFTAACGAAPNNQGAATPSLATSYTPTSTASMSGAMASASATSILPFGDAPVPRRGAASPPTSIVVRPDALAVDFAMRTVVDEPDVGVRILAEATKTLEARFVEIVPRGSLTIRMRALNVEPAPHASGKVVARKEASSREPVAVSVEGRIVVAMGPTQDYWERSHLFARMNAVADRTASTSKEGAEAPHHVISFGHIEPHVRAPDAMRAELAQRWATQRKQAVREVQAGDVTLARDVCAPAAQVVQRVISFEEIELTLPIECRRVE